MHLDAGRLRDLRIFSREELRKIGQAAIRVIAEQLDALDRALADNDLSAAGEAAHRARNEALLVGARELCEAFASLERAAREREPSRAGEAARLARALWPETRTAIEEIAAGR